MGTPGQENKRWTVQLGLHAAGIQTLPSDGVLAFAINTFKGWSTIEQEEFDVSIDTDGDGFADYVVFNADVGLVSTGSANGQVGAFVENLKTKALSVNFLADAPTDGSTIVLPVLISDLGLSSTSPRFTYTVKSFDQLSNQTEHLQRSGFVQRVSELRQHWKLCHRQS